MALFARDGVAPILTPIVIDVLRTPDFEDETKLAFVMAAGLVSDTAGLPLVVTNLVNIVSAAFFKTGLPTMRRDGAGRPVGDYRHAARAAVLLRRDIPRNYDVAVHRARGAAIRDAANSDSAGSKFLPVALANILEDST